MEDIQGMIVYWSRELWKISKEGLSIGPGNYGRYPSNDCLLVPGTIEDIQGMVVYWSRELWKISKEWLSIGPGNY